MKKDKNQNYASMTIEEIETLLTPREIKFIEYYEETSNATDSAQHAGYSPDNRYSAKNAGYRLLRKPNIMAYRHAKNVDLLNNRNISREKLLLRVDDIYLRAIKAEPHMILNKETKELEPDGTWIYDSKTALFAIRIMGNMYEMLEKQMLLDVHQESIEEYLHRMGEQA
jgi:phage terminase small subunit